MLLFLAANIEVQLSGRMPSPRFLVLVPHLNFAADATTQARFRRAAAACEAASSQQPLQKSSATQHYRNTPESCRRRARTSASPSTDASSPSSQQAARVELKPQADPAPAAAAADHKCCTRKDSPKAIASDQSQLKEGRRTHAATQQPDIRKFMMLKALKPPLEPARPLEQAGCCQQSSPCNLLPSMHAARQSAAAAGLTRHQPQVGLEAFQASTSPEAMPIAASNTQSAPDSRPASAMGHPRNASQTCLDQMSMPHSRAAADAMSPGEKDAGPSSVRPAKRRKMMSLNNTVINTVEEHVPGLVVWGTVKGWSAWPSLVLTQLEAEAAGLSCEPLTPTSPLHRPFVCPRREANEHLRWLCCWCSWCKNGQRLIKLATSEPGISPWRQMEVDAANLKKALISQANDIFRKLLHMGIIDQGMWTIVIGRLHPSLRGLSRTQGLFET